MLAQQRLRSKADGSLIRGLGSIAVTAPNGLIEVRVMAMDREPAYSVSLGS